MEEKLARAKQLLNTVRHAAMATVNADGSPHNTPYFFMHSSDLRYLYWGSHPDSLHSQNVLRTGQVFVVLYDAMERGGLFIRADEAHPVEGEELDGALEIHNARRLAEGSQPLSIDYYRNTAPHGMWMATTRQFWTNDAERDKDSLVIRDIRVEISRKQLLD